MSVNVLEQIAILKDGETTLLLEEHRYLWVLASNGQDYRFAIERNELVLAPDSYPSTILNDKDASRVDRWIASATTNRGNGLITRSDRFSVGDLVSVDASGLYSCHKQPGVSLSVIADVWL